MGRCDRSKNNNNHFPRSKFSTQSIRQRNETHHAQLTAHQSRQIPDKTVDRSVPRQRMHRSSRFTRDTRSTRRSTDMPFAIRKPIDYHIYRKPLIKERHGVKIKDT